MALKDHMSAVAVREKEAAKRGRSGVGRIADFDKSAAGFGGADEDNSKFGAPQRKANVAKVAAEHGVTASGAGTFNDKVQAQKLSKIKGIKKATTGPVKAPTPKARSQHDSGGGGRGGGDRGGGNRGGPGGN